MVRLFSSFLLALILSTSNAKPAVAGDDAYFFGVVALISGGVTALCVLNNHEGQAYAYDRVLQEDSVKFLATSGFERTLKLENFLEVARAGYEQSGKLDSGVTYASLSEAAKNAVDIEITKSFLNSVEN